MDLCSRLRSVEIAPSRRHMSIGSPRWSRGAKPRLIFGRTPGLAALALSLYYEMTTFDRGFSSFRGLHVRLLTLPDS
jgi:hypothetical protein